MHRGLVIFPALVLVLSTAVGIANADTSGGCSGPAQCRTSGRAVDASWSEVPADGPVLGTIYTDTYVAASTSMTSSKGTRTDTGGLWFTQFSYRYDSFDGKPTPIAEKFVQDLGTDLVISVDAKLRTATVSGSVLVVSCTIDANYNQICGDPVATAVRGSWTATGPALSISYSYRVKGPGFTMNSSFSGTQRDATAAVTIGGAPVPGAIEFASISDGKSNSVTICHAPTC